MTKPSMGHAFIWAVSILDRARRVDRLAPASSEELKL